MTLSRYWRRRALRHGTLAALTAVSCATLVVLVGSDRFLFNASMATAYVSLALLAVSLVIGPLNVIRRIPNPVSTDLRRDVGIWTGIVGLAHLGFGLTVHFTGRPWLYFLYPADQPHVVPVRYDLFGIANHTGLVAGLGLVLLLVISNDRSLARLGTTRWKRLQQLAYFVAILTVVHAVTYQVLEDRWQKPLFIAALAIVVMATTILQVVGVRRVKAAKSSRLIR